MKRVINYFKRIVTFEWCIYTDQFQLGISMAIHNIEKDIEYPEVNIRHAHIWIDLGFRCLEITFGGKQ